MHPGGLELVHLVEHSVGDTQHVLCTFTQKEQAVAVQVPHTMWSKHTLPVVFTNSGIEVTCELTPYQWQE